MDGQNELSPAGGAPIAAQPSQVAPTAAAKPATSEMAQHFSSSTAAALARFHKLEKADQTLKAVRGEMDKLVALGDMVQEEDVLSAASALVGAGLTAAAVAGLLADMPPTPEGMQQWVAQHDQDVKQREVQLGQVLQLARHDLAMTGLRQLMAHGYEEHQLRNEGLPADAG